MWRLMDSVINYSEHTDGGFYRSEDATESLIPSQYCYHVEFLQWVVFTVITQVYALTEKCRISMHLLGLWTAVLCVPQLFSPELLWFLSMTCEIYKVDPKCVNPCENTTQVICECCLGRTTCFFSSRRECVLC